MEALDLDLRGFEDCNSILQSHPDPRAVDVQICDDAHGRKVRAAWTTELNNDLINLATISKQSRRLHVLRIQATSELLPLLDVLRRHDYLFLSTIAAFLSARNLTKLELDLCGTQLTTRPSREHVRGFHICTSIPALLTTLQYLRLRMRVICADVLKPRQHSTDLQLNEVLINLSLSNESPLSISAGHAEYCGALSTYGRRQFGAVIEPEADMKQQAQVLVTHMAVPKLVRILTHTPSSIGRRRLGDIQLRASDNIQMQAFDALTGRDLLLSEGAGWDDDGEAIED